MNPSNLGRNKIDQSFKNTSIRSIIKKNISKENIIGYNSAILSSADVSDFFTVGSFFPLRSYHS